MLCDGETVSNTSTPFLVEGETCLFPKMFTVGVSGHTQASNVVVVVYSISPIVNRFSCRQGNLSWLFSCVAAWMKTTTTPALLKRTTMSPFVSVPFGRLGYR